MSYKLQKPYTETQRADFIVLHNHQNGRTIEEVESGDLFALEPYEKLVNGVVIDNTEEYEALEAQKEAERISKLTCTKRNFALMLQQLGVNYNTLKELIATNEQAQLEWDLCVELERSNPLLDIMAVELNVTPQTLDKMFRFANGEINSFLEVEQNV